MQVNYRPIQTILEKAGYRYYARIGDDNSDSYLWWMPTIPGHTLESLELSFDGMLKEAALYDEHGVKLFIAMTNYDRTITNNHPTAREEHFKRKEALENYALTA
jgi:hypothetical protein